MPCTAAKQSFNIKGSERYGCVILTGKRAGSAVVTVTDPGSGASCSVKVTVLPQFLQSVMRLLVRLQTVLAEFRIRFFPQPDV